MLTKALHPADFRIVASLLTVMASSAIYGQSETDFESDLAQSPLIHTADAGDILVVPFAQGLANPFDLAFRDNGYILVTERYTGQLRVIREGVAAQYCLWRAGGLLGSLPGGTHVDCAASG